MIGLARADIVDLTNGIVYEILCSEKEDDCDEKVEKYPDEFRVVKVKVNLEKQATENL